MNILDKIVAHKLEEVQINKKHVSKDMLMQSALYERSTLSMVAHLNREDKSGIIAEFKRKSPSKSNINIDASVKEVTEGYVLAGASGISVLTDRHFFGAHEDDIRTARQANDCPILRKDFIIDPYQIHEAKTLGADIILLIAEILTVSQVNDLANEAKSLGLEVLMEIHSEQQLDKYCTAVDIVGVNNRNLETFEVSIENSIQLSNSIPSTALKISESGISNIQSIQKLKEVGFQGFLIGEHFMAASNPAKKCKEFINELNTSQIKDIVNP